MDQSDNRSPINEDEYSSLLVLLYMFYNIIHDILI